MANDLQTTIANPIVELTRLTTPLISSALVGDTWQPEWGRRVFDREGIDPAPLIAAYDAAVQPVPVNWLADRLRVLWKSSPISNGIDATAWLHETTRLLADLPHDLAASSIDEAARKSAFVPTVAEIRAIAEPQLKRRRLHLWRLKAIARLEPEPPLAPEERCTPEQAAEIIRRVGLNLNVSGERPAYRGSDEMRQRIADVANPTPNAEAA